MPMLAEGQVHFVTLAGTLKEPHNATSSPVVSEGPCDFSQREAVPEGDLAQGGVYQSEHIASRTLKDAACRRDLSTSRKADDLDHSKRRGGLPLSSSSELKDIAVEFGRANGGGRMYQTMGDLGRAQALLVWAYHSSKTFVSYGRLFTAHGDTVSSVRPGSDEIFWKKTIGPALGEGAELLDSPLTPPAIVNGKLFFGSIHGLIHCLTAETGEELWSVPVGEPVDFQPAVARGRVYAGTDSGTLVCFETGDTNDDRWLMWGATGAHNGLLT